MPRTGGCKWQYILIATFSSFLYFVHVWLNNFWFCKFSSFVLFCKHTIISFVLQSCQLNGNNLSLLTITSAIYFLDCCNVLRLIQRRSIFSTSSSNRRLMGSHPAFDNAGVLAFCYTHSLPFYLANTDRDTEELPCAGQIVW